MNSIMDTVLQYTQPNYWAETNYHNVRLKKFSLSRRSDEYSNIRHEFLREFGTTNYEITEITRIQHPYAYASCQIRRKQLGVINGTSIPPERRFYLLINNVNQIAEFLKYNCDDRRASCVRVNGHGLLPASGCVVMAKEIVGQSYRSRSSNRYPDYLIKYRRQGRGNNVNNLVNNFAGLRVR